MCPLCKGPFHIVEGGSTYFVNGVPVALDVMKTARQWHAHCPCGSGYNLDGTIHDKGKGDVNFSNKTVEWLNDHGWETPKK